MNKRAGPRAMRRRHPVGEIEDDAGKEPRLGDAEQHAEQIEAPHPAHQHHRHRDQAPADHDPRDPPARADALEDQVARHFEQAVAEEEQARAEPEGGVGEPEVALQLGGGKPDVHPVDVRDDVAEEDERDQAHRDAPDGVVLERVRRGRHGGRNAITIRTRDCGLRVTGCGLRSSQICRPAIGCGLMRLHRTTCRRAALRGMAVCGGQRRSRRRVRPVAAVRARGGSGAACRLRARAHDPGRPRRLAHRARRRRRAAARDDAGCWAAPVRGRCGGVVWDTGRRHARAVGGRARAGLGGAAGDAGPGRLRDPVDRRSTAARRP